MKDGPIRVGIIGLNPGIHWAATAHMPALAMLPEFEVVGCANSSPASGQRAAEAFGLRHAFEDAQALVASDDVDLVVVTVKVPHHRALVMKALAAGKHVYCEWPLGNGLAEAREMADAARAKGVVAAVGTQMRTAPEVPYVRQLIADGYVGEILSTTIVGSGMAWGAQTDAAHAYLFDRANGATTLSIPLGHTLAGVKDVLGDFADISARMLRRRSSVLVADTGETIPVSSDDQILVHGMLASGAPISIHYRGGVSRGTNFLWEINGTDGDLQVVADSGHAQLAKLSIRGERGGASEMATLTPPTSVGRDWPDTPAAGNVARLYALIAEDIRNGTRLAPSFDDAVALHATIDAIERASRSAI